MGHLARCLALADEATARGWQVEIVGDISRDALDFAKRLLPELPVTQAASGELSGALRQALTTPADVLHIDSYWDVPKSAPSESLIVSNMQDGPYGVRAATLAVDANLGAENWFARQDLSGFRLIGIDAAVIRRQVLRQRADRPSAPARPSVLVVMGGTDPDNLASQVAGLLAQADTPLEVIVIAARQHHERIEKMYENTPHELTVVTFVEDLPEVARRQTLIVTAAGTSVWDFAAIGVPMALLCAVDNQRRGYDSAISAGFGFPLGVPPHDDLSDRVVELLPKLFDAPYLDENRRRLLGAVDGLGAWRIVSAWESLTGMGGKVAAPTVPLIARRALLTDARTLFDWRNHADTRANSRETAAISWDDHANWLERTLLREDRQLFIIEDALGHGIGTVRWDRLSQGDWEVSITVAPEHRGRGMGYAVLQAGERALETPNPCRLLASVHVENEASGRLFRAAGYLLHLPADALGFTTSAKWRLVDRS